MGAARALHHIRAADRSPSPLFSCVMSHHQEGRREGPRPAGGAMAHAHISHAHSAPSTRPSSQPQRATALVCSMLPTSPDAPVSSATSERRVGTAGHAPAQGGEGALNPSPNQKRYRHVPMPKPVSKIEQACHMPPAPPRPRARSCAPCAACVLFAGGSERATEGRARSKCFWKTQADQPTHRETGRFPSLSKQTTRTIPRPTDARAAFEAAEERLVI